jgi:hypothetical protein
MGVPVKKMETTPLAHEPSVTFPTAHVPMPNGLTLEKSKKRKR